MHRQASKQAYESNLRPELSETSAPSFWQIAQLAATVLGIVIAALVAWWLRRERKELSYDELINAPLVSMRDEAVKKRLRVLFDTRPVDDPRLIVVRFGNTGNRDILDTEFEKGKPIILSFGKGGYAVHAEAFEMNRPGLQPTVWQFDESLGNRVATRGDRVEVDPLLLNQGDEFNVKMLVGGYSELIVRGRIAGVKQIEKKKIESYKRRIRRHVVELMQLSIGFGAVAAAFADIQYFQGSCVLSGVVPQLCDPWVFTLSPLLMLLVYLLLGRLLRRY